MSKAPWPSTAVRSVGSVVVDSVAMHRESTSSDNIIELMIVLRTVVITIFIIMVIIIIVIILIIITPYI